ncbi:guanylate kinase [Candidatus Marinamargulisbacteria bacterium SCGC AG-439-L15]|nr:guanylate kinase [Candidatus Marinamargulisbacteria bacterium SCGC AG-439-L15]
MKKGHLFIISGPSGVGKGTIIKGVLKEIPELHLAISATTRPARETEVYGKDYFFLTNDEFDKKIEENAFLEWCPVHNYRYGTLKEELTPRLNKGENIIIEIDTEGAKKIMKNCPESISIFIAPPKNISNQTLLNRLSKRNTESKEEIQNRMKKVSAELADMDQYDHQVINDKVNEATKTLVNIILNITKVC